MSAMCESYNEKQKVYVKTDDPCPEYLTAGKVYEVIGGINKEGGAGIGRIMDDCGAEIVALIGLPTSHLYGGMWTRCDQHGNPVVEQGFTVEQQSSNRFTATSTSGTWISTDLGGTAWVSTELERMTAERDRYKALAGELAEALKAAEMQAEMAKAIQHEVVRLRETIAETKRLLPDANTNWFFYDTMIALSERAVREQDAAAMLRILPELQEME
jgi:hypothetical protein